MPLLCHISDEYTRIFQTLQRTSRRHTYVTHQDIIQSSEKKQTFANSRLKERCDHNCVWENKKKKKSNDQQALDGPICSGESGKKAVSGG